MEILLWLLPAAVVTGLAMVVAAIAGRERPTTLADRARAQERLAEAVERVRPESATVVRPRPTMSEPRPVRPPAPPAPAPARRVVARAVPPAEERRTA